MPDQLAGLFTSRLYFFKLVLYRPQGSFGVQDTANADQDKRSAKSQRQIVDPVPLYRQG
jgi:hypothetical protein